MRRQRPLKKGKGFIQKLKFSLSIGIRVRCRSFDCGLISHRFGKKATLTSSGCASPYTKFPFRWFFHWVLSSSVANRWATVRYNCRLEVSPSSVSSLYFCPADIDIVGAQWGDEGKGKLVDVLCDDVDIVARCQVRLLNSRTSSFFRAGTTRAIPL